MAWRMTLNAAFSPRDCFEIPDDFGREPNMRWTAARQPSGIRVDEVEILVRRQVRGALRSRPRHVTRRCQRERENRAEVEKDRGIRMSRDLCERRPDATPRARGVDLARPPLVTVSADVEIPGVVGGCGRDQGIVCSPGS